MAKEKQNIIKRFQVPLLEQDSGFDYIGANVTIKSRLFACTYGRQGTGKSYLELTAMPRVAIIDIEQGLERAMKGRADVLGMTTAAYAALKADEIHVSRYQKEWLEVRRNGRTEDDLAESAANELMRMRSDYLRAIKSGDYRTVCVDTLGALYQTVRMAVFGRLEQIMKLNFGPVNKEMELWMTAARESDVNVIFTHRAKDEYIGEDKSGRDELAGWKDVLYEADLVLEHVLDESLKFPDCFGVLVHKCSMNPQLRGTLFNGADAHFATIASAIYPDTKRSDWE